MRPRINDIRVKAKNIEKSIEEKDSCFDRREFQNMDLNSYNTRFQRFKKSIKEDGEIINELLNPTRRNFLRVVAASGGVLLLGSFLNKINNIKDITNVDKLQKDMVSNGSRSVLVQEEIDLEDLDGFRLVSSDDEYILYNKRGESIITVDKDA